MSDIKDVAVRTENVISICTGAGGLDLGIGLAAPNLRTVCYIEREAFAAAHLVAAIQEGFLDDAPIWSDLTTFDGSAWRGQVDWIVGGIPCQPHSAAGKRLGADDPRDLWPATSKIIRDVEPSGLFLENVPGFAEYYFARIRPELQAMGYRTQEGFFSAAEVGAPHRRQRFFVLAYAERGISRQASRQCLPERQGMVSAERQEGPVRLRSGGVDVGYAFPPGPTDSEAWTRALAEMPELEPALCRESDGLAQGLEFTSARPHRFRLIGNGVVPLAAAHAFRTLSNRR